MFVLSQHLSHKFHCETRVSGESALSSSNIAIVVTLMGFLCLVGYVDVCSMFFVYIIEVAISRSGSKKFRTMFE